MQDQSTPLSQQEFNAAVEALTPSVIGKTDEWEYEKRVTFGHTWKMFSRIFNAITQHTEPASIVFNPSDCKDPTWSHYFVKHFRRRAPWDYDKRDYIELFALIRVTARTLVEKHPTHEGIKFKNLLDELECRWSRAYRHREWSEEEEKHEREAYFKYLEDLETSFKKTLCNLAEEYRLIEEDERHMSTLDKIAATYENTEELKKRTPEIKDGIEKPYIGPYAANIVEDYNQAQGYIATCDGCRYYISPTNNTQWPLLISLIRSRDANGYEKSEIDNSRITASFAGPKQAKKPEGFILGSREFKADHMQYNRATQKWRLI